MLSVRRGRPDLVTRECRPTAVESYVEVALTSAGRPVNYYAAIFEAAAASELEVIMPLRPVGKKPPCVLRAFPPSAR